MSEETPKRTRRQFLAAGARLAGVLVAAGALGGVAAQQVSGEYVWQIDPDKCTACLLCASSCVLTPSASKAVHEFSRCGYCKLCFGYFRDQRPGDTETAENERCPTQALKRTFIEDPYNEYKVDESKCIGCAKCVKGCQDFGNGSLIMQIRHDRCVNCNECAIAQACPAQAVVRVPAEQPYLLRANRESSQ